MYFCGVNLRGISNGPLHCSLSSFQAATSRGSLVLIDRTLDLVGPSGHTCETLADRLVQLLPRLPEHKNDIAVNMSSVCSPGRWGWFYCARLPFHSREWPVSTPAASSEILPHTVWRTWLFIAYSDERWLYYQSSPPHCTFLFERLENVLYLWNMGMKGLRAFGEYKSLTNTKQRDVPNFSS